MTTYQKLKQEVTDLKKELDVVVNEPDSFAASSIKMKWMLNRRMENKKKGIKALTISVKNFNDSMKCQNVNLK